MMEDDRNWVDMASDKPADDKPDVNTDRPRTTGSINERKFSGKT